MYAETDERDTTYFILYQLRVIRRAIDELYVYLTRKVNEVREFEHLVRRSQDFNHRQFALLSNAVRHPSSVFSFQSHARSHNVTHETARHDLLDLRKKGLLDMERQGRKYVFRGASDLAKKLGVPKKKIEEAKGSPEEAGGPGQTRKRRTRKERIG